ncbi:MAG: ABC transporter ATP-binding protein [Bacilli bacterium]|nr:ABC transporter ATP-binding protein [Bacilli bacterium]
MENEKYAIEMIDITKSFPGIKANDHINLRLKQGEILSLCGENGAGKSTLMSILFGLIEPDEGYIKKDGQKVHITNPNDATDLHIGMVHQHFKLVENFTVLQNIILGSEPLNKFKKEHLNFIEKTINFLNEKLFKTIDYKTARQEVESIIEKYDLPVDLDAKIEDISVEMQQKTEILKMLYRKNDILIFDEPTAVLTEQEIKGFLQILRNLKKENKSIVFITHKLNEIMEVCDRVAIIRKGAYVDTLEIAKTSKEEISALMVGRQVNLYGNKKVDVKPTKEVLRVENLTIVNKETNKKVVNNVSFNVRKGEIVCVAGIDGNGQQELIYGITGLLKTSSGKITLSGKEIQNLNIRDRNNAGIAHIPEDRHKYGLVLDYSIDQNVVLEDFNKPEFSKFGFIKNFEIQKYSDYIIEEYDVRSSRKGKTITRNMSGGNQQKVIIGREIERNTDLLIAVQPTRGLDVGAIEQIHDFILKQREKEKAILLVSLELDQVFGLSDRILVMFEGEIVGEFKPSEVNKKTLGLYMSGGKKDEVQAIKKESN